MVEQRDEYDGEADQSSLGGGRHVAIRSWVLPSPGVSIVVAGHVCP